MTEQDILKLIESDEWMMQILRVARDEKLPDWMIGAGFVRNKVWDHLHGIDNEEVQTADIDLIYYDPTDTSEETEKEHDTNLGKKMNVNWSTKNQARMHKKHNRQGQYTDSTEALSEWVEIPTCVAVQLDTQDALRLIAPHGISDLVNLIVRPTPAHRDNLSRYWQRIKSKGWEEKWPKLTILEA
jgi:hypothetical protein